MPKARFYLDYAASTPVDPRVEAAMRPYFLKKFGNAGSLHSFGQEALAAVDSTRETVASAIGAGFREIIFTGSATEANNLALRGAINATLKTRIHPNYQNTNEVKKNFGSFGYDSDVSGRLRIIVSAIEHESILETARDLEREGVEIVYLPVDRNGIVDLGALQFALNERTILVSLMYANNETGVIQPIAEIAKIVNDFKATLKTRIHPNYQNTNEVKKNFGSFGYDSDVSGRYPILHTDAVQAFQFLDCDVDRLGVDMMTLSAHKIYGPKGAGALYLRNSKHEARNPKQILSKNVPNHKRLGFGNSNLDIVSNSEFRNSDLQQLVSPIVVGGGQEFGLRSGTENVPLIVGFGKAVQLALNSREKEGKRIASLRDRFWQGLKKIYPRAELNGIPSANNESITNQRIANSKFVNSKPSSSFVDSVPYILNVYFPNHDAQDILTRFDLAGIAVSAGSACSARSAKPSYVIAALGYPEKRARQSIRFSFGRPTTKKDIDSSLKIIRKLL